LAEARSCNDADLAQARPVGLRRLLRGLRDDRKILGGLVLTKGAHLNNVKAGTRAPLQLLIRSLAGAPVRLTLQMNARVVCAQKEPRELSRDGSLKL
jgi:hypothetical protein